MATFDMASAVDQAAADYAGPAEPSSNASEDLGVETLTPDVETPTASDQEEAPVDESLDQSAPPSPQDRQIRERFNRLGNELQTLRTQTQILQQQLAEAAQYRQRYETLIEQQLRQQTATQQPVPEAWAQLDSQQQQMMKQIVLAALQGTPLEQQVSQLQSTFQQMSHQARAGAEQAAKTNLDQAEQQYGAAFKPYRPLIESTLRLYQWQVTPEVSQWLAALKTELDKTIAQKTKARQNAGVPHRSLAAGTPAQSPKRVIGKKTYFDWGRNLDQAEQRVASKR